MLCASANAMCGQGGWGGLRAITHPAAHSWFFPPGSSCSQALPAHWQVPVFRELYSEKAVVTEERWAAGKV